MKPIPLKNYYRIRITDQGGSTVFKRIITSGSSNSGFEVRAITNDKEDVILHLNVSKDQMLQMKIISADGILVYSQSKIVTVGTDWMRLQSKYFKSGLYTLQVYTNEAEIIRKKFIR